MQRHLARSDAIVASVEDRELKDGTVIARVRYRVDGRNKARSFDNRDQAERWKALLDAVGVAKAEAALAQPVTTKVRTVAEQVAHHIDHLTGIEDGTRSDYRVYLERDIAPRLGNIPITLLTEDDVAAWVNYLDKDRTPPLARKSIANRHSLLSAALRSAVRADLVTRNVAEGVRMPTRDADDGEMVTLTLPEVWQFVAGAKKPEHRPLLLFLFGTGVRFGEATALRVRDVDVDNGLARIRRAWKHTDGNGHKLGTPKSRRSIRTIVFGRAVADAIRPLLDGRPADAFLFTNSRGGPIRRTNFHGDVWTPALRTFAGDTSRTIQGARGRPRIEWTPGPGKRVTPHDARHTYASLQLARGRSMVFVQRQLGHENINTTVNTYGHLQTGDLSEHLADVIDKPLELEAIEG